MKKPLKQPDFAQGAYWSREAAELLARSNTPPQGLSAQEAAARLESYGENTLKEKQTASWPMMLLNQFKNPLIFILVFAAVVSALVSEYVDTVIVLVIVLASALMSFWQEYSAGRAVEKLRSQVTLKSQALRDGTQQTVNTADLVPGDLVLLSAGSLVPADGVVLESRDFFVSEAVLTGETFPVEKQPGVSPEGAPLSGRTNLVFMGTSVRSGTATVLLMRTGLLTEFGRIADKLNQSPPETEFEKGIRRFGALLSRVMLVLVSAIFIINTVLHRPVLESLLFAIALAVGLTPELLPAIISISLARGARGMAKSGVIVRRLNAIENLGSMDVLCTDKTGTGNQSPARSSGSPPSSPPSSRSSFPTCPLSASWALCRCPFG